MTRNATHDFVMRTTSYWLSSRARTTKHENPFPPALYTPTKFPVAVAVREDRGDSGVYSINSSSNAHMRSG